MAARKSLSISTITKITTSLVIIASVALLIGVGWFVNSIFSSIHKPQQVEPDAVKTQQINLKALQEALEKNMARTSRPKVSASGLRNPFVIPSHLP